MPEILTPEQKEYLIEKALSSEAGRQALASSMANPCESIGAYCGDAILKI